MPRTGPLPSVMLPTSKAKANIALAAIHTLRADAMPLSRLSPKSAPSSHPFPARSSRQPNPLSTTPLLAVLSGRGPSFKRRREYWCGTVARWSASPLLWLDCLILVGDGPCLHSSLVRGPAGSIPARLNDGSTAQPCPPESQGQQPKEKA